MTTLDATPDVCQTAGMTNTNHTATFVIRLDDVRLSAVVSVGKAAIRPLAGPAIIDSMQSYTQGTVRMAEVKVDYFAANLNEAIRTAKVFRSAILPIVTGCTILSTGAV